MKEQKHIWSKSWPDRLMTSLENHGFNNSIIAFAKAYPGITLEQLISKLDEAGSLVPIQLTWALMDEAATTDQLDWFARDFLIRQLQDTCKNGWNLGELEEYDTISATASWAATIKEFNTNFETITKVIWERLKSIALPGWLPTNIDDPIIEQAFDGLSFNASAVQRV
jgi:hypothetical protein